MAKGASGVNSKSEVLQALTALEISEEDARGLTRRISSAALCPKVLDRPILEYGQSVPIAEALHATYIEDP